MLGAEETAEPPGSGVEDLLCLGYLPCLQHCLGVRGETASMVLLMGLSGEAFRLFYHRDAPERGPFVLSHNPLRAASGALGYDCQIEGHEDQAQALCALEQAVSEEPAILRCAEDWVAAAAVKRQRFRVRWRTGEEEWWPAEVMSQRWRKEPGFLELGPAGYYYFRLAEKERNPDIRESGVGSLRRGMRLMMRRSKVEGAAAGLSAYEEMANSLTRRLRGTGQAALALRRYAAWKTVSAPYAVASRRVAVQYIELMGRHFGKEPRKHMEDAAEAFGKALKLLQDMPDPPWVPSQDGAAGGPSRMALWQFARTRRQAASRARRLRVAERQAADAMRKAADSQERLLRS